MLNRLPYSLLPFISLVLTNMDIDSCCPGCLFVSLPLRSPLMWSAVEVFGLLFNNEMFAALLQTYGESFQSSPLSNGKYFSPSKAGVCIYLVVSYK